MSEGAQQNLSDNIDNLLGDIYSSSGQSQGVKELAVLINNISQLLLRSINQLEGRVTKLEQQLGGSTPKSRPAPKSPTASTPPAPRPKVASPFGAPTAPARSTPPPPPAAKATASTTPSSATAAAMLGVTLKSAPKKEVTAPAAVAPTGDGSSPAFLTGTVNETAATTPVASATPGTVQPDAVAPTSAGIAGPAGGFKSELAEKLARRSKIVQQQLDDDFESPDLQLGLGEGEEEEESASSELKLDLEDELRSAFSKLKG